MAAEQQAALVRVYITADARIRAQILAAVVAVFRGLGSWRDTDIERFTALVLPAVLGAQRQSGSLAQAYITALLADMTGDTTRPSATEVATGAALRNGTVPAEVYARPIRSVWKALATGEALPPAVNAGALRLGQLLTTDLQLAKTHAVREALAGDDRVAGYRRVLTGRTSCGLCVLASTQRYHRGDLMPIHPGCDCAVAPIVGTEDPGHVLDQPLLDSAHEAIADRFGTFDAAGRNPLNYRDAIVTHEHGEIGPVLARRGDDFTGPSDLH